jgi:ComF family protein
MKPFLASARLRAVARTSADFGQRLRNRSALFSRIVRAALPSHCALCGNAVCGNLTQQTLCEGCDRAYWRTTGERCHRCALSIPAAGRDADALRLCGACIAEPPAFDATIALADYRAPLAHLAVELKFHARLAVARDLAGRFVLPTHACGGQTEPRIDVIIPVPLSAKRLAERGYNQAWEIAKPLARRLGIRADAKAAARTMDTPPQAKLDAEARHRNVRTAFTASASVRGLHLAVVDDVMTSGATLDALARTLKRAGAARVTNLVAFRTPKD